jgi:radical SAM superfamily enzyme YgiQ (UPF0313 family)
MRITLVQPAIGHRSGESYIRSWQMEPLPIAALAGITPDSVDLRFYDDRMESIPFDEPTDAVAMPVETYTAHRAYQIASEYRRRGVPVIMGGFHPTLMPDEASRFAEAIVTGEAEAIWPAVIDDLRHKKLGRHYQGERTDLSGIRVDRRPFLGKNYLPIGLVETGRGCRFPCEFCSIQTFFERSYRSRPTDDVVRELQSMQRHKKLFFFVDDNFAGDMDAARVLMQQLEGLNVRWITQLSINAAHDEDFLCRLARSGCRGVLIGFESLDENNLRLMHKHFNTMKSGYAGALDNLRRYGIAVYGTFIFGYEHDHQDSFAEALAFAQDQDMYVAAFNHLTPFPGTPLYLRLQAEGRLRYESWWLDKKYRYNEMPFVPKNLTPEAVTQGCVESRRRFYAWPSILKRSLRNRSDFFMLRNFFPINALHRNEISQRNGHPLGGDAGHPELIEVA